MDFQHKKIGIWGFGVVGKSVIRLLAAQRAILQVYDNRTLNSEEVDLLDQCNNGTFTKDLAVFLASNDYLVVSPGVDMRNYQEYVGKCISELDIFYSFFKKPIIALTGTIGKTTSVHLIAQLLQHKGIANGLGGNVGYAMCDLIQQQDAYAYAVLELSSFQLDQVQRFAPSIAVWTNFYPNHLDRHGDLQSYFLAKYQLIRHQQANDIAIINYALKDLIYEQQPTARIIFFTDTDVFVDANMQSKDLGTSAGANLRPQDALFFVRDEQLYLYEHGKSMAVIPMHVFPRDNFLMNYLVAFIVSYVVGVPLTAADFTAPITLPAHRVEKFLSHNGATFYNDSKSTVAEATLAAVKKFSPDSLILVLGGMGKGVDRTPMITALKNNVRLIIVFGKEAAALKHACEQEEISVVACQDLHDLVPTIMHQACSGDTVLFSPSGASFDLFTNYEDRGNKFKQAILAFCKNN